MNLFKQVLKRIFLSKLRFAILLIIPVFFILMFAQESNPSIRMTIVDQDQTKLSGAFIQSVSSLARTSVSVINEDQMMDKTVSFNTEYTLIIPKGFEDQVFSNTKPTLKEFYIEDKELIYFAKAMIETKLESYMLLSGNSKNSDQFYKMLNYSENAILQVVNTDTNSNKAQRTTIALGFILQFMLYMSIVTTGILLEDKSKGVFHRTLFAPIRLSRYFIEHMGAFIIAAFLQVIGLFALLKWVLGFYFNDNFLPILVLFLVFSVFCISFGMWITTLFKKPLYAYLTVMFATTPLVMLGGCYWPMSYMPDMMQKIAQFLPTTWVTKTFDPLLLGIGSTDILPSVLVLLLFTAIFFAAGMFRKVDIAK